MRYFRATEISKLEATFIIETTTTDLHACVVVEHEDRWFDVRHMAASEIDEFIAQLIRSTCADALAGLARPH